MYGCSEAVVSFCGVHPVPALLIRFVLPAPPPPIIACSGGFASSAALFEGAGVCCTLYGKFRLVLVAGGDIKYIKTSDFVTWSTPVTIYEQSLDMVPRVIANQLIVHNGTSGVRWLLPYWKEPADISRDSPCTLNPKLKAKGTGMAGVLMRNPDLSHGHPDHWKAKGTIKVHPSWFFVALHFSARKWFAFKSVCRLNQRRALGEEFPAKHDDLMQYVHVA